MTLFINTWNGFRYLKWSKRETICYLLRGISRETNIALPFFERLLHKSNLIFLSKYLDKTRQYFDFNGAKLPNISNDKEKIHFLRLVFEDVFLISCKYGDNYSKGFVETMDKVMAEGTYSYRDGIFDVTVKNGDIVIDAGAWIGDFSAYSVSKGATVYAFEPTKDTYQLLCKTKELNANNNLTVNKRGDIYPIRKGLGRKECNISISISNSDSSGVGNSIVMNRGTKSEEISIITLDKFVEENNLKNINFIKADIEGAERDLLTGATNVLKKFAPKLSICTYHLPDDPEVLEKIIMEANPNYKIVHLRSKLFAAVV